MDGSPNLPQKVEPRDFALKEWEGTKSEIRMMMNSNLRVEMLYIAAIAGFYSWLFTTSASPAAAVNPMIPMVVLCIFSGLLLARLRIEYSNLYRLGEYAKSLEDYHYGATDAEPPIGWENFLIKKPAKSIPLKTLIKRYSNSSTLFGRIFFGNLIVLGSYVLLTILT